LFLFLRGGKVNQSQLHVELEELEGLGVGIHVALLVDGGNVLGSYLLREPLAAVLDEWSS
jgi:hypothetical protein